MSTPFAGTSTSRADQARRYEVPGARVSPPFGHPTPTAGPLFASNQRMTLPRMSLRELSVPWKYVKPMYRTRESESKSDRTAAPWELPRYWKDTAPEPCALIPSGEEPANESDAVAHGPEI